MKERFMSWTGRLMLLNDNTNQSDLQVPVQSYQNSDDLITKSETCIWLGRIKISILLRILQGVSREWCSNCQMEIQLNLWVDLGCLFTTHFNILTGLAVCHVHHHQSGGITFCTLHTAHLLPHLLKLPTGSFESFSHHLTETLLRVEW